ncbi:MAG: hypothetical protein IT305_06050 [Chloroflexi bacterium]|nr:hypothetical protein [Chloroflexota bacterium]
MCDLLGIDLRASVAIPCCAMLPLVLLQLQQEVPASAIMNVDSCFAALTRSGAGTSDTARFLPIIYAR